MRSFKPRRRSLSPTRAAAYERAMTRWGIATHGPPLSLDAVFGGPGPVVLDIGFGSGEALIELAEIRPDERVIGIDVHTPGVAAVLEAIEARGLANVRVAEGDALDLLGRIPARSVAAVRIFFPDPWPKRRQRARRLLRAEVVDRLVAILEPGGTVHVATDDQQYAGHVRQVCDANPLLRGGIVDRPAWRPTTRYEQRALDEGRASIDLLYISAESSDSDSSSALR
jgi:tRNA (guanine-N7-)-methyltransferase